MGVMKIIRDVTSSFCCCLLVLEKATNDWGHIIYLSQLNSFMKQTEFRMVKVSSAPSFIREGNFLASLNVKDVYLLMFIC